MDKTPALTFTYRNWRGEISKRIVRPIRMEYGSTEWHPEPQWLLIAWDEEKQAERSFAVKDIIPSPDEPLKKFKLKDHVKKTKGSSWQGRVVGFYSTDLTPIGYAVESEREPGSVQIYPESALELVED